MTPEKLQDPLLIPMTTCANCVDPSMCSFVAHLFERTFAVENRSSGFHSPFAPSLGSSSKRHPTLFRCRWEAQMLGAQNPPRFSKPCRIMFFFFFTFYGDFWNTLEIMMVVNYLITVLPFCVIHIRISIHYGCISVLVKHDISNLKKKRSCCLDFHHVDFFSILLKIFLRSISRFPRITGPRQ